MGGILFLAHRFPYPPDRGDKIRSWHILKALTAIAPVHVCCMVDDPRDLDHLCVLEDICETVSVVLHRTSKMMAMAIGLASGKPASVAAYTSPALQKKIDHILNHYQIDTIFAFSGQMAQFVPKNTQARRFVMDFVDVDSAKFMGYANQNRGPKAFANRFEGERLAAFEREIATRADVSLFVSNAEADLFRNASGFIAPHVQALENGIDLDRFDPALPRKSVKALETPLIVFTGQMDYPPNVEAVTNFARATMPKIRRISPDACFVIVGRAPTAQVRALARLDGVSVTGEVPDTRDWLAAADVVVAPLTLARGVQNKVLEAMAMAKAVVASSAAAEGIDASAGLELIVADGSDDEAAAILALLADQPRRAAIGAAARLRMVARYSWAARLAGLPQIVRPASSAVA